MQEQLSPQQVQPSRNFSPSYRKQDETNNQIQQENGNPQVKQFREDERQLEVQNEISMNSTQINLQIVKILQQMEKRIPQNNRQISQKSNADQTSQKIDWKIISFLMLITLILSSAFSVGICCALIKYGIITINPVDNTFTIDVLKGVSEVVPSPNQTQSLTSNSFCGTINLNIQNGTTISNGTTSNTQVTLLMKDGCTFPIKRVYFRFILTT